MARYRNPDSEENIRRIDSRPTAKRQTHGFQVHFSRAEDEWTKLFGDGVCDGKEEARRLAREFRAELKSVLPLPATDAPTRSKDKRNKFGKVGFSFTQHTNKDGSVTRYISASARIAKNKAKNTKIRIEAGDISAAIAKAEAWRDQIIQLRLSANERNA